MVLGNPPGYYGTYNPQTKNYRRVLYKDGECLQAAELNDRQLMDDYQRELLAGSFYKNGTYISGGLFSSSLEEEVLTVNITAGQMYALGFIHNVPAGTVQLTGVGTESIYLKIEQVVVTYLEDPDLRDPATGSENEGEPGADRLEFAFTFAKDDTSGILLATYENGQLVVPPSSASTILQQILDIIALREWEKDGSFLTAAPRLRMVDFKNIEAGPVSMAIEINGGTGRVRGQRWLNGFTKLSIQRPLTALARKNEPETFNSGTKVYSVDNTPLLKITDLVATLQTPSFQMTRGQTGGGQDAIPSQYQPTESIVSISQGATTYTEGDDYTLSGNYINWAPAGLEPTAGSSYNVVLRYTKSLTKAIRTQTYVATENQTVNSAACATTHADLKRLHKIVNTATPSTVYVEGTDYSVNLATGVITWDVDPGDGTGVTLTYTYWAHTVEGDFVSRDSFIDENGDTVIDGLPAKTPTGVSINFKTQVSFDVSGGSTPVTGTNILMDYEHVLPRKDVLVWKTNGLFEVVPGTPAVTPKLPNLTDEYLPVAKINLPAEAMAADVSFETYDNLTMKVTDLRALQNTVDTILYNETQFQLYMNIESIPTATDKRGIFADDLSTLDKADLTHEDHECSISFLGRFIGLPRTSESSQPALSSSDASVKADSWFPTYTEKLILAQPFSSTSMLVNAYDSVNLRAKVSLSKQVDSSLNQETALIRTVHDNTECASSWVWDYYLISNLTGQSKLATQMGEAYADSYLANIYGSYDWGTRIHIEQEWTDVLSGSAATLSQVNPPPDATVLTSNKWATILQSMQVVVKGDISTGSITISGSHFTPNEAAIQVLFGKDIVALTPAGSTAAETDPAYPGTVKADSSGNWQATFNVPAGTKSGNYQISVFGRDPTDKSKIKSYATTYYQASAYVNDYALYLQIHDNQVDALNWYAPFAALRDTLGIPTSGSNYYNDQYSEGWTEQAYQELYLTGTQPLADTIATAIKEGVLAGVDSTFTEVKLAAAITAMLAYTGLEALVGVDQINAMANAANLHTTNVAGNSTAIQAASAYAKLRIADFPRYYYDPVAQTFTLPSDMFVSSLSLWFDTGSTTPVTVAICETANGYPTNKYFSIATLAASSINSGGSTKTTFTFDKPVFLKGGVEYGFVVATADTAASLRVAVVGQNDPTNGLIVKNAQTGALFRSPNARAWELVGDSDIKFELNQCSFTNPSATLSTGAITFSTPRSRFVFSVPFVEVSKDTRIVFQYSLDNQQWRDFSAGQEVDLGLSATTIYVRILLYGTAVLMPAVWNDPQLTGFIFTSSGAYVGREFSLQTAEARFFDLWVDVDQPGGTTFTPGVDLDEEGFEDMAYDAGGDVPIDNTWVEKHYTYDTGGDLKQLIRLKLAFTSTADYITPRYRRIRFAAREG